MIKDPEVDRLAVVRQLAEAEQQEFLAFAKGLTPQQWQAPTLCLGLSTRDIVVHVAWHFKNDDGAALVPLAVRSRFQLLRSGLRGGESPRRLSAAAIRIAIDRGRHRLVVVTDRGGRQTHSTVPSGRVRAAPHRGRRLECAQRDGDPSTRCSSGLGAAPGDCPRSTPGPPRFQHDASRRVHRRPATHNPRSPIRRHRF